MIDKILVGCMFILIGIIALGGILLLFSNAISFCLRLIFGGFALLIALAFLYLVILLFKL